MREPKPSVKNTGNSIAIGGLANSGIIIGDPIVNAWPIAHSAYLHQVRRMAPESLQGRMEELYELSRFCTQSSGPSYMFLRADAWAGKSALLTWFVLHPPPATRIISFFITARFAEQSDRRAFVDVVLEQFAELLKLPAPSHLTDATREAHLLDMMSKAVEACRTRGERLVLVVDGLDEDRGATTGPDAHSIAALLPASSHVGIRVIVSGRPNPPVPDDVPRTHPLRDERVVRILSRSPFAEVVRQDAKRELKYLLQGSRAEQDLLGVMTAARGGLSGSDLAELTGLSAWEIDEHLNAVSGRTFASRTGHWAPDRTVYVLAHEEIQEDAIRALGVDRIRQYQTRLLTWAEGYRINQWPKETPEYLLRGYYRLLVSMDDVAEIIRCTTDWVRHDRMLETTGGDSAALAEIVQAQAQLATVDDPDLMSLTRLAVHRQRLQNRNRNIPWELPAVWMRLGEVQRSEALALSITRVEERAKALTHILTIEVEPGDAPIISKFGHQARTEALQIPDEYERSWAFIDLAKAALRNGFGDIVTDLTQRVSELAKSLIDPDEGPPIKDAVIRLRVEVESTVDLVSALREIQDLGRQAALLGAVIERQHTRPRNLDDIDRLVRDIEDRVVKSGEIDSIAPALAALVRMHRAVGNYSRAQEFADRLDVLFQEGGRREINFTVFSIIQALVEVGSLDRAHALLDHLPPIRVLGSDPSLDAVLAVLGLAVKKGDASQKDRLVKRAVAMAESKGDLNSRAIALAKLALMFAELDNVAQAKRFALEAESLSRKEIDHSSSARTLAALVVAISNTGQAHRIPALVDRCLALATSANNWFPGPRLRLLGDMAAQFACAGYGTRAVTIVESIEEGFEQAWALLQVARSLPLDEAQTAIALVRRAEDIANRLDSGKERLLGEVAASLAGLNSFDEAESIAESLSSPFQRAWALAAIAGWATDSVTGDRIASTIGKSESLARSLADYDRSLVLPTLADAQLFAGRRDQALLIARSINDVEERAITLLTTLDAETEIHARHEILLEVGLLLDQVDGSTARARVQREIVVTSAKFTGLSEVLALSEDICNERERDAAIAGMVPHFKGASQRQLIARCLAGASWDSILGYPVAHESGVVEAALDEYLLLYPEG
jgi:tetratricopeptide (TPR) repeat protein